MRPRAPKAHGLPDAAGTWGCAAGLRWPLRARLPWGSARRSSTVSQAPGSQKGPRGRRNSSWQALTGARAPRAQVGFGRHGGEDRSGGTGGTRPSPGAPPLQDYNASMRLRVQDAAALDHATKRAMRDTRALGGFVASIDFGTRPEEQGMQASSSACLWPKVQEAVARYTELGTIVSQQVKINDLQPQADRLAQSATELQRRIAELVAKSRRSGLTVDERIQLENARRDLQSITGRRSRLVREASYATVTLELTTAKAAEKQEDPGAFRTFWDDASKILGTELIWLLYALVVAGPFVLLAILAFFAERSRRRRSADSLLADDEVHELARARRSPSGSPCRPGSPAPSATPSRARPAPPRARPPAPRRGRAPSRSPGRRARTCPARAAPDPPRATAAPTGARGPAAPTAPRRCAARTAGSATPPSRPRTGRRDRPGARDSSLTSSITAAIGVLNWKRRSMSSVTRAIVRCAVARRARSTSALACRRLLGDLVHDPPQPAQEARDPLDALLASTPCPGRQGP